MRSTRFWNVRSAVVLASFFGATASPADTIEPLGSVGTGALPATRVLAAVVQKDGQGVRQLAEAYGATMAVVYVLKPMVDRQRPVVTHKRARMAVQPAVVPRGAGSILEARWQGACGIPCSRGPGG
jgi:hypothetical protein